MLEVVIRRLSQAIDHLGHRQVAVVDEGPRRRAAPILDARDWDEARSRAVMSGDAGSGQRRPIHRDLGDGALEIGPVRAADVVADLYQRRRRVVDRPADRGRRGRPTVGVDANRSAVVGADYVVPQAQRQCRRGCDPPASSDIDPEVDLPRGIANFQRKSADIGCGPPVDDRRGGNPGSRFDPGLDADEWGVEQRGVVRDAHVAADTI